MFLEDVKKDSFEQDAQNETHIHPKFQLPFSHCGATPYEGKRNATTYLKVVADVQVDFGKRDGHSGLLHLAHPGVQLLAGQQLLNPFQRLHMVGHDEDHAGLLMGQRHAQHKQPVLSVLMEVIQTCGGTQDRCMILVMEN